MPRTHPPYSAEIRQHMVELVRAGRAPNELSREFEPSAQAIRSWVAKADRESGQRSDGPTCTERTRPAPRPIRLSADARDQILVSRPSNPIGRNGSQAISVAERPVRPGAPAGPEERANAERDRGSSVAEIQVKRPNRREGRKSNGTTADHQLRDEIIDAIVPVERGILPKSSAIAAYDEEYPLDSLLEMDEQESTPRRWLGGLVSIMGLAAFVALAWYVYKPDPVIVANPSTPAVFASDVPIAKNVTSTAALVAAPTEESAMVADPAAARTNSDKVGNLAVTSPAEQRLLQLSTPFMRGPDVMALQRALAAKDIAIDIDGVYGWGTKAAVMAFQKREGLTPNGIVGPETRSRLR